MGRVAQLVEDGHIDVDFVDINLGCPIDMVYKRGMGSGLMGRKKPLEVMVKSMTQILNRYEKIFLIKRWSEAESFTIKVKFTRITIRML